jgi:cytochrome c biogenesis protein
MGGSGTSIGKTRNLRREAWHTLCSIRLTIILLSAILFVSVLGTLFPQPTPETQADELALAQWEAALQERYGAFRELYRALGFLNIYSSPIFLILLVALLVNGVACTFDRLGPICKVITARPKAARPDSFYERATNRASLKVASIDEARKQMASLLSRHRYRLQTEERDGVTYIVGHKNRLARVGTLITHTALVLIAVGALWSSLSAWREPAVVLGPGQSYDVGHGHQFHVQHKGFEVVRYANGFPKDYRSHLLVLEQGSEVLRRVIRVNDPLTYRGVSFYLSSSGPALRVLGWEEDGEPLPLQLPPDGEATRGEAVLNFSAEEDEKSLYLPSLDMTLQVSLYTQSPPEDASEEPFLFVEAFPTGQDQPLFSDYVGQGETVQLSNATLQFIPDTYSVIQVVSDPGFAPIVMASFLGMGGLLISFYFHPGRVWAKLTGRELLLVGSAEGNQGRFEADFAKLVEELEARLR